MILMNFDEYINRIGFRIYKQQSQLTGFRRLSRLADKVGISLEVANTKLPQDEKDMKRKLRALCKIRKMSTFAIAAMINRGVSCMSNDTCFVNVGVWNGFTFFSGTVGNPEKQCMGIDNFSQFGAPRNQFLKKFEEYKNPNHYFFDMDCIDYFSKIHTSPIGFYVYDGEHSYDNQLKGLQIAEPFFSEDCIILVDDTNWREPREATLDFINRSSKKYKMLLDETTLHNGHPTLWNGVMIFRRC